jgi:excisionase family DNA binding protein
MNAQVTYDNLPQAVMSLHEKLDVIGSRIENLSRKHVFGSQNDPPIDVEEAAKLLKVSKAGIYSKVSRNAIPYYKIGGKLYFSRSELLDEIQSARHPVQGKQKTDEPPAMLQQLFLDKSSPSSHQ